jgi:hypothetical protein
MLFIWSTIKFSHDELLFADMELIYRWYFKIILKK